MNIGFSKYSVSASFLSTSSINSRPICVCWSAIVSMIQVHISSCSFHTLSLVFYQLLKFFQWESPADSVFYLCLPNLLSLFHSTTTTLVPLLILSSTIFRIDSCPSHLQAVFQSVTWVSQAFDKICYYRTSSTQINLNLSFLPYLHDLVLL